jgi:hypothetical protein
MITLGRMMKCLTQSAAVIQFPIAVKPYWHPAPEAINKVIRINDGTILQDGIRSSELMMEPFCKMASGAEDHRTACLEFYNKGIQLTSSILLMCAVLLFCTNLWA